MATTVTRKGNEIVVEITETSVGASTEVAIPVNITRGRIVRQICVLTSGSGSTVDPIIGIATNPAGVNVVIENGTGAATVDNQYAGGITFSATGTLYHRSKPDSGSDNAVSTTYHIVVGWGD